MAVIKYVIDADESGVTGSLKRIREQTTAAIQKDFAKVQKQQIKLEINRGDQATIASGSVAEEHAKRRASANAAYSQSAQRATQAVQQQVAATTSITALQKAQIQTIEQLLIKMQSYHAIVSKSTDR